MSDCERCGKPVRWLKLDGGRREPLDVEPAEEGDVAIIERRGRTFGRRLRGKALSKARESQGVLYRSHYATCPNAEDWRRP